jgi:cobaltochelatase CobN
LILALVALMGGTAVAQEGTPAPAKRKDANGPVRMAILTVRTNTSTYVEAYARFCEQYGKDKLALDLWVQEDWLEAPRPLELVPYDLILALRCSIPGLDEAVAKAAASGSRVVAVSPQRTGGAVASIDEAADLAPYYRSGGTTNTVGLLERVCQNYGAPGVTARAVVSRPQTGLYHPDADQVFPDAKAYWAWYRTRPGYRDDAPKIAYYIYNTLYLNEEFDALTQLVRTIEASGASPIVGFAGVGYDSSPRGAMMRPGASAEGEPKSAMARGASSGMRALAQGDLKSLFDGADVMITSAFRMLAEHDRHIEALRALDVPVLNGIILNISRQEWEQSGQGVPGSYLFVSVVSPELSGILDPSVIAARQEVTSPVTGQSYYRTVLIEENLRRLVARAKAWARLKHKTPAERRVAVLYYNHAGGKQAMGASYLNVSESLSAILADWKGRGYGVEGTLEREALLKAIQAGGRNAGAWAPGEVDALVANGAVLWPVESYLAHFDRLPNEVKQAMTRQWGQPPGDIMTVTRDGRRYFVLPALVRGNVLIAPQPLRAHGDRQDAAQHDPALWPTHQYLAFYLWLRHEWKADAVVHLGRHGTLEFLPGKSNGLDPDDPPPIVLGDLPNINPYIVDGIGEAVAAKRRGGAVIITHATPPIVGSAASPPMTELRRKLDQLGQARRDNQPALVAELESAISKLAASLGYSPPEAHEPDHDHPADDTTADVAHWLDDAENQFAPRGLHTFGQSYNEADVAAMLPLMFRDELAALKLTADELTTIARAEGPRPTADPSSEADNPRTRIAQTAWDMRHNAEQEGLARALDARYIEAGPPGDPLSNPATFPTGRNQHQSDTSKIPTREAWAVGRDLADKLLDRLTREQGRPPERLGFTLWANTLIRTQGALEAEVLHLMGVEPVWNARGDVTDVKLTEPLDRPRIDVVLTITGMYRDTFADKALLLDRAVQLASEAADDESSRPNFVRRHVDATAHALQSRGMKPDEARGLARLRIFGAEPGQYGSGMGRVPDSQSWSEPSEIARDYADRMGFAFSAEGWARPSADLFREQLQGVEAVVHGRSSHLYGVMDITENYEYQGGMALAVEQLGGKAPKIYVNDTTGGRADVRSAREAVRLELASRYLNPDFIRSMQAEGFDGARYLARVADIQFGWDVVSDTITAEDWQHWADVYLNDAHNLGLKEFFEQANPHAIQTIAARILEVDRKGLQHLDPATVQLAATRYVESVAAHGASCNGFICDGPELNALAASTVREAKTLPDATVSQFEASLQKSTVPASETVPVEGLVIARTTPIATAPQPSPPPAAATHEPPPDPKTAPPSSGAPSPPPAPPELRPQPDRTVLVAAVVCLAVFVAGLILRRR